MLFSGDLGRTDDAVMRPPAAPPRSDWVVVESTYGDRLHADGDAGEELAATIRRTAARGGMVLVPSFAVGRAQMLLHQAARQVELMTGRDAPLETMRAALHGE